MDEIIKKLTFKEKVSIISFGDVLSTKGMKEYEIPVINMSDGPHGVRKISEGGKSRIEGGDTCFPTASALASSWNKELAFETGAALAKDCIEEDIQVILGPAVNMKRTPHCGRNFEYFSEDPYLAGIIGAQFINGVQSKGVGTCLKHFAANNQEINRGTINAEIDERTLREYYLRVYEIVLRHSNPTSVMCAYNKLNGIWCSENRYLLTEMLKDEWGYDGLVMSDWGAVHDISKAIGAGLDLEMPCNDSAEKIIEDAIEKGIISEEDIDRAVGSMLNFIKKISNMKNTNSDYSRKMQHDVAYRAACETITLLKNEKNVLPITKEKYKKIAVIGKSAKYPVFMGGGSSKVTVDCSMVDIPIDNIIRNAGDDIVVDYYPIFKEDIFDERIIHSLDSIPDAYECAVLFIDNGYGGDSETESFDRDNIKLPNYINGLIAQAAVKFPNTVLVVQSGAAVIPYRWDNINSVIWMWYSGEGAGKAIADILFGKVNPSGKISETFMKMDRRDISYPGDGIKVVYKEGADVGYRYYDRHPEQIWYPFGHGLSYTRFEYIDIDVDQKEIFEENFEMNISCKIKNTGNCSGKEVVQVYISPKDNIIYRPLKELRAFEKIELSRGEEKEIKFKLSQDDFAYYNVCLHKWHIESGKYDILIGASSCDIRQVCTVSVNYDRDYTKDNSDNSAIPV